MLPTLHIYLLGDFRLVYGEQLVTSVSSPRLQSLLVYLILHRGSPQSRQHLAFLLWPDSSEPQARTNLRYLLHQLRQTLPASERLLASDTQTLQWRSDAPFSSDVDDFEKALAQATSVASLREALELYRGDLLPSCYDDWILPERERLRQMFIGALEKLTHLLEAQGDYHAAIQYTQLLLRQDSLSEEAYRQLMRLHALSGDPTGVLRAFQTCEIVLKRELDAEVSAATRDAYEQLLKPAARPEPGGVPSVELRHHNLPFQLTSFIGREREIAELRNLLSRQTASEHDARLLTLTGTGGCGKTRLALQAAGGLLSIFSDGVWFVDLASINDPSLVVPTIAQTLDVRETPGKPLLESLKEFLRDKQLLLLLDNFERVITAAPMVGELLNSAPHLKVLVTSREVLRVYGEHDYPVSPLSLPDPQNLPPLERLAQVEAVRLFVERARAAKPDFSLTNENAPAVAEICFRLDGLPLAIELAAARVRLLPPQKMVARLDNRLRFLTSGARDLPARQQTLRSTLDWSYELLTDSEKMLFRHLAVFASGCTLEAAESVCNDDGRQDVLNGLQSLMDQSLLKPTESHGEPRFNMLETIREYAFEQLATAGELDTLQERHLRFFLGLAEELEPQLRREQQQACLDRLEREHDNLRTALEYSVRMHRDGQMLRLGSALYLFWRQRDFWSEARKWFEFMLALDVKPEHGALRQKVLAGAAYIAMFSGDLECSKQWARACIESSQTTGECKVQGEALTVLGEVAWEQNEYAEAQMLLEQAQALFRQVDDQMGVADACHWLGHLALDQNDYEQARSFFLDSYTRLNDFGDRVSLTLLLNDLGLVSYLQEDYPIARAYSEQNLELCREIGSKFGMANTLNRLGDLARCEDDYGRADALYHDSLSLFKEIGEKAQSPSVWHNIAYVRLSQGKGVQAASLFNRALNEFRERGDKKGVMDCLTGLAGAAIQFGQPEKGALLLGASEMLNQEIGAPPRWPANHIAYKRHLSRLHEQMDETTFQAAWEEGRALTLEQAINRALLAGDE